MKKNVSKLTILSIMLTLILSACTPVADKNLKEELDTKNNIISSLEEEKKALEDKVARLESLEENPSSKPEYNSLLHTALDVVEIIKNKDMNELSSYIHPTKGIRFSPYDFIDLPSDQVFTVDQITGLMVDTQIYSWGSYDGSGEPINLSFSDYYKQFVYEEDFVNPNLIGNNVAIGKGNTVNNIEEAYPTGEFVEFHFTGIDPKYEGIDWRSLKVVFEDVNGIWYLVGIVHGQWTI